MERGLGWGGIQAFRTRAHGEGPRLGRWTGLDLLRGLDLLEIKTLGGWRGMVMVHEATLVHGGVLPLCAVPLSVLDLGMVAVDA